jgi:hypothetical protein
MCSTPPRKETSASSVSSDLSPWGPSEVCHDDDGSIPLARPFVICRNERTQCIKLRFRIHRQGLVVPRSQPAAAHVVLTSPHLTLAKYIDPETINAAARSTVCLATNRRKKLLMQCMLKAHRIADFVSPAADRDSGISGSSR